MHSSPTLSRRASSDPWPMHMQDNRGGAALWRGHQGDLLAEGIYDSLSNSHV